MTGTSRLPAIAVFWGILVLLALPVVYIVSGQFMGRVNNDTLSVETEPGASHLVAATARMIDREIDSGFCPSSYIWPGHIRFDICGFQEGQQQIWSRLAIQFSDHLSREGPTSDRDQDLATVLANINRPNTWSLFFPSNNTASLLSASAKRLDQFNARLAQHKASYYPRIDNLSSLIGDITNVLGSEAQRLTDSADATGLISMNAREAYFHALGTMAATCYVMQAMRMDFVDILKLQSAEEIFDQAMHRSCEKIGKNPTLVINGDELSHLRTLSGVVSATVNNLSSLQNAIAAAARGNR